VCGSFFSLVSALVVQIIGHHRSDRFNHRKSETRPATQCDKRSAIFGLSKLPLRLIPKLDTIFLSPYLCSTPDQLTASRAFQATTNKQISNLSKGRYIAD
jgi:hypothetical protein